MDRIQFIFNNKVLGECNLPNMTSTNDRRKLAVDNNVYQYDRFIIFHVNINKLKVYKSDSNLNKKFLEKEFLPIN